MKAKKFFWNDKSGRGFSCILSKSAILGGENEYGWGDISLHEFARTAGIGDEWEDGANKYIRIE